jgi:hypothetical protein
MLVGRFDGQRPHLVLPILPTSAQKTSTFRKFNLLLALIINLVVSPSFSAKIKYSCKNTSPTLSCVSTYPTRHMRSNPVKIASAPLSDAHKYISDAVIFGTRFVCLCHLGDVCSIAADIPKTTPTILLSFFAEQFSRGLGTDTVYFFGHLREEFGVYQNFKTSRSRTQMPLYSRPVFHLKKCQQKRAFRFCKMLRVIYR